MEVLRRVLRSIFRVRNQPIEPGYVHTDEILRRAVLHSAPRQNQRPHTEIDHLSDGQVSRGRTWMMGKCEMQTLALTAGYIH